MLAEVQEHLLVVSNSICKFSESELNINAEDFEVYEKILTGGDMSFVSLHRMYFL
jgi:hypothetical protein